MKPSPCSKMLASILGGALFFFIFCPFGRTKSIAGREPVAGTRPIKEIRIEGIRLETLEPLAVAPQIAPAGGAESLRIHTHPLGFTFKLSSSWRVEPAEDLRLSLIPPDKGAVEGIFVLSEAFQGIASATDPSFAVHLDGELKDLGEAVSFLRRQGAPEPIQTGCGPGVLLIWEGVSPEGVRFQSRMYAVIFEGNALVIFAIGPRDATQSRDTVLRRSFISFSADQNATAADQNATAGETAGSPLVQEWKERLNGMKLSQMSSYSSGGGGGGMSSQSDLYLNTDGSFIYRSSSQVSMSVPGASGSSSGRNASAGRWSIITDGTQVYLELRFDDAATQRRVLTSDGTKTFLNGTRTYVLEQEPQ